MGGAHSPLGGLKCTTCYAKSPHIRTHLHWLVPLGEDVQKVSRGDKVEPWESQLLGLQVLSKSLLTNSQPAYTQASII